jgi:hypothetical protein
MQSALSRPNSSSPIVGLSSEDHPKFSFHTHSIKIYRISLFEELVSLLGRV